MSTSSKQEWLIAADRVGKITPANCTREAIRQAYGATNVVERNVYFAEGTELPGMVVFAGTKNELDIAWDDEVSREVPAFMRTTTAGTDWTTAGGITIGSTLAQVNAANGNPFEFSGFGWDYGGNVVDWKGGKLAGIIVTLDWQGDTVNPDFLGERSVTSNDPGLDQQNVRVSAITVRF
jgi:hypothetical protein